MNIKNNKFPIYLFFTSVSVFLVIRLILNVHLNLPLHFDEAQYWDWSKKLSWGYFSKPPLLSLLIRFTSEVCGDGENCIRSLSPIIHSLTSSIIFYSTFCITKKLKNALFGGFLFLIMPGITFSSLMISTDVPLMFFSACAGLFFIKIYYNQYTFLSFSLLTLVLALGILSKYATLYLFLSSIASILLIKESRKIFFNKNFIYLLVGVFVLVFPNIYWNYQNGFVTFTHTVSNANLKTINLELTNSLFFLVSQFLIFGLIPFIYILKKGFFSKRLTTIDRIMFLNFMFPILVIFFLALFSRANANWAVVGYPFGCIFIACSISFKEEISVRLCFLNQIIFSLALVLVFLSVSYIKIDPFYKIRHIRELANEIGQELDSKSNIAFMADDREDFAHLLYYLRNYKIVKVKWNGDSKIDDHYELTTNTGNLLGKNVLFLTRTMPTQKMIDSSKSYEKIKKMTFNFKNRKRVFNLFIFKDWK